MWQNRVNADIGLLTRWKFDRSMAHARELLTAAIAQAGIVFNTSVCLSVWLSVCFNKPTTASSPVVQNIPYL